MTRPLGHGGLLPPCGPFGPEMWGTYATTIHTGAQPPDKSHEGGVCAHIVCKVFQSRKGLHNGDNFMTGCFEENLLGC